MKRIYWRPKRVPRSALVIVAVVSVAGLAAVEHYKRQQPQPYAREMLDAAQAAMDAMDEVQKARDGMGPIDPVADPARSGLIGTEMTPVTSDAGFLSAKQTSVNPNWAAVVVQMLRKAGVQPEDTVAVGYSGSFPALNICVLAACQAMHVRPIIVASVSASQWGANDPKLLWLDMERLLYDHDILQNRSAAASLGGLHDTAAGASKEGVKMLEAGIERTDVHRLTVRDEKDSIAQRMAIYHDPSRGTRIAAYINVGGNMVSVGGVNSRRAFRAGLNMRRPAVKLADSVMTRFLDEGVPVIHLERVEQLAGQYGLPLQPQTTPRPGEGGIYSHEEYNRWLAGGVLVVIVAGLYLVVHSALGHRLLQTSAPRKEGLYQEPMV
jgi:poly-gamma-glutamate system protein